MNNTRNRWRKNSSACNIVVVRVFTVLDVNALYIRRSVYDDDDVFIKTTCTICRCNMQ